VTHEPGGTPLADEIRTLLLARREETVFPETEFLLYEAARAQHVRSVILPALASGNAVLCDRFCDATVAYQGFSRGIDIARIEELNAFASAGLVPDLTFLLDIPSAEGLARVSSRGSRFDRLEAESLRFHQAVREGYLRLCAQEPLRFARIDGRLPVEDIARAVRAAVSKRFGW
jgi:dTMP kinase